MKRPRAVAVHSLSQARLALQVGVPVTLLSGEGAGWYAGAGWWLAMMAALRSGHTPPFADILDCADAPGAAMAGLRLGQRRIVLDAGCPALARVAAVAATLGGEILTQRPNCLDLGDPAAERGLANWLAGPDAGDSGR